ncbi:MAG: hypothetical protein Q9221_007656 [Calogaya cf. arnoldii]
MSHLSVDSIISADAYNGILLDHEASERAALLDLKRKFLPSLSKVLDVYGVADSVELHLIHRHFVLQKGEALVHEVVAISGSPQFPDINVDIAKAITCPESLQSALAPILWMASPKGDLVAYEYSVGRSGRSQEQADTRIPLEVWDSFARAFAAHVYSVGIADIVGLKSKACMNGGEYVAPDLRVLFRVPMSAVDLQPGSGLVESGWTFDEAATESDGGSAPGPAPHVLDTHVTQTRQTTGGTVAQYHKVTQKGATAFNPNEIPLIYTDAIWAAADSKDFGAVGTEVDVLA